MGLRTPVYPSGGDPLLSGIALASGLVEGHCLRLAFCGYTPLASGILWHRKFLCILVCCLSRFLLFLAETQSTCSVV